LASGCQIVAEVLPAENFGTLFTQIGFKMNYFEIEDGKPTVG